MHNFANNIMHNAGKVAKTCYSSVMKCLRQFSLKRFMKYWEDLTVAEHR